MDIEELKDALGTLVDVKNQMEALEAKEKEESEASKAVLEGIRDKYREPREVLRLIDANLRDEVMEGYKGTKSVLVGGVGELVFPVRWTYTVVDALKLKRELMCPDTSKIGKLVKGGIRKIAGVEVEQKRGLEVRRAK